MPCAGNVPVACSLFSSLLFSSLPRAPFSSRSCQFARFFVSLPTTARKKVTTIRGYREWTVERLESTTVRDTRTFNFFPLRGIGLRNALPLRLEESVKNKGAWKRGKDKGRDKDEGGRETSWKLVPGNTLDGASCKCTGARHGGAGGGRSFEPAALVRRQY